MDLTTHVSVDEYFHEVIVEALERTCVRATEGAECYLVNLLGEFIKARLPDEPLSIKLARAQSNPAERVKTLKEVGDTTLYVTGFFAASLERRLVDATYYRNLGEAAYGELARRLQGNSSIGEIYGELAAKFPRFVDVLAEVRKQVDCASADVVSLYEQWLATRSEWVEHRLRALGVMVSDDSAGKGYLQ